MNNASTYRPRQSSTQDIRQAGQYHSTSLPGLPSDAYLSTDNVLGGGACLEHPLEQRSQTTAHRSQYSRDRFGFQGTHQYRPTTSSSSYPAFTEDLSPGPNYRLFNREDGVHHSTVNAHTTRSQNVNTSRRLPPLESVQIDRLPGSSILPTSRLLRSSVYHNQPPPLTAGILLPGPYSAYPQHQNRYLPPVSSASGFDSSRHRSLASQASALNSTYIPSRGSYTGQPATSSQPLLDPLGYRYPTPAFKYLLPEDPSAEDIPSAKFAYALIAQEEERFRRERQFAGRSGNNFVFEPARPIVYESTGQRFASDICPPPSVPIGIEERITTLGHPNRREHSSYYDIRPVSSEMPPRRAVPSRIQPSGVISGSVQRSYGDPTVDFRSACGSSQNSELPIVRSTRAKVYRKDMVMVAGRQHSITIVDDDSGEEKARQGGAIGLKRKVGSIAAVQGFEQNGPKKRKGNSDLNAGLDRKVEVRLPDMISHIPSQPASFSTNSYSNNGYHGAISKAEEQPVRFQQMNGNASARPAPASATDPPAWDDKDGHYIITPGRCLGANDKYKIVRLLGQGTFGKVVEAESAKSFSKVAIKIIRAVPKYREASTIEIRVLKKLKEKDPINQYKCISLLEYFDFRNHICLVTPLLGQSVFDFLKENGFQPFPEAHIHSFAKDLLTSLGFVHSLNLIHTDLKPENILLVHTGYYTLGTRAKGSPQKHILRDVDIRLIDFGSATFDNEFHSSVVSTRHYRAPEIILGLGWSFACDIFSIGCILVEFFTGDALFQTHDNLEHLAMMEVVMGKLPPAMSRKARAQKGEFFKGTAIDFPNSQTTKNSKNYVKKMKRLEDIIRPSDGHTDHFCDLVSKMLHWDPQKRITVDSAVRHPYVRSIPKPPPPDPSLTKR